MKHANVGLKGRPFLYECKAGMTIVRSETSGTQFGMI